jgi:hypothetical protein
MLKYVDAADLSVVPHKVGRQLSAQPHRPLTFLLAEIYLDLTGQLPTRSRKRGGFGAFAREMFEAMQIQAPVDYVVQAACDFVKKKAR